MTTQLNAFLNKRKVVPGSALTHTSMTGGSYYIPVTDEDEFIDLYHDALEKGADLHLTEKHRDISPILIDLDFRQKTKDRLYNDKHITDFLSMLKTELESYFETNEDNLKFFVFEKLNPRAKDKLVMKDGLHIMCPYIVSKPNVQYVIRSNILSRGFDKIFEGLYINTYEDMYDETVIYTNNWCMYGSKKKDEEYGWGLTKIYDSNLEEIININDDKELLTILSIRNKFDATPIKTDKMVELKLLEESKNVATQKQDSHQVSRNTTSSTHIDFMNKLVDVLSVERADNYHSWIKVGLCLHNIDDGLLHSWTKFSQKSSKYRQGECEKLWNNTFHTMDNGGMKEGTLYWWAKEDSPKEYNNLMKQCISRLIYTSRNETNFDVAKVVHFMYKTKYVCVFVNNKPIWYEFKKHRWVIEDGASSLRINVSTDVFNEYSLMVAHYHMLAALTECDTERISHTETAKKLGGLANKLKMTQFKAQIIKECESLFKVSAEDFLDKLDQNPYLIGLNNGIYDLKELRLRDGQPNDYITKSVGYDFADENTIIKTEIMAFITEVMPNAGLVEYLLFTLAYILTGNKYLEQMWFWTGGGRNGKGTIAWLLSLTLKDGQYYVEADSTVFTSTRSSSSAASSDLMRLKDSRVCIVSEADDGEKNETLKIKLIKKCVGRDKIQGREMYGRQTEFAPTFSMIFMFNDLPKLSKVEQNLLDKMNVIRFPFKFTDNPEEGTNQKKINKGLKDKFTDDIRYRQQFFRILLEYYVKYNISNRYTMPIPDEVKEESKEYFEDNNEVGAWLKEKCIVSNDRSDKYTTQELFNLFKDDNKGTSLDHIRFGMAMAFNKHSSTKSDGVRYYRGIKYKISQPFNQKYSFDEHAIDDLDIMSV